MAGATHSVAGAVGRVLPVKGATSLDGASGDVSATIAGAALLSRGSWPWFWGRLQSQVGTSRMHLIFCLRIHRYFLKFEDLHRPLTLIYCGLLTHFSLILGN